MGMNIDIIVSVPATGLANLLANVVGQQVGPAEFEQFKVKLTTVVGTAAGVVTVNGRASGRVLKDTSVVTVETGAGLGAAPDAPFFINETVQRGEQLFMEAFNSTAGAINVRVQATSEAV